MALKKFSEYVQMNEGKYGSAEGLVATDFDGKPEIMVYELVDYEESRGWVNLPGEIGACIYVMPDDTVEIRSVETEPYCIHAKFPHLTGEDVRKGDLHRHRWVISNQDNE